MLVPPEAGHPQAALGEVGEHLATEEHDSRSQQLPPDPQMESIQRLGRLRHRGFEPAGIDRRPEGRLDLSGVEAIRGVAHGDFGLPPLLVLRPVQESPLVLVLRHPAGRVPDPHIGPTVEGVRDVRMSGRP